MSDFVKRCKLIPSSLVNRWTIQPKNLRMDYPVIIRNGFPILGRVNARESITTFHHILSECKLDAFIKYKVGR